MLGKLAQIPRFYPAEYAAMLITSMAMLFAGSVLASMLVNYWLNATPSVWADISILNILAVLIIVLPIHLILYIRVRRMDRAGLTLFAQRVTNAFLALYLFVTAATVIALTIWLLALWLNTYLGAGSVSTPLYIATWSLIVAIGFFKYATWHFLRTRTDMSRALPYVLVTSIVGLGLIVLGFAYPVPAYRDAARDFVKENDLAHIQRAVGSYADTHEQLPANLEQLEGLDDETKRRLDEYRYTPHGDTVLGIFGYQLCANFATDGHDFGFPAHGAGEQCEPFIAISGTKLAQGLADSVDGVEDGLAKLQQGIRQFLLGAGREVSGIESSVGGQLGQLERYLEGVEGGSQALQQEMQRLEQDITSSAGISGQLEQEFAAAEKFIGDLLCALDPQCTPN